MIVRQRFRGLFQKYLLVLFMAVAIPLAINGVIEAWLGYRDQRARLEQLLGIQATSAAARIQEFIDGITYDGHTPNAYLASFAIGLQGKTANAH